MEWIDINDRVPDLFQEVIIASTEGRVKAVTYMGSGKWNTFLQVAFWMPMPEPPDGLGSICVEEPKKRRGRPKKA